MSGRVKQRTTANVVDAGTVSVNERILQQCHSLYTDTENGLITIAANLGLKLLPPRKKISVMLIGNHSAGKSTFINWYIEEHVQRTGVAIETQGFTFVTSGKKRESLTGNATLHLYPHFKPLNDIPGAVDYLSTEISTSKQKKFSLVTFVDTPGLVDGDMKYPFDVNQAIIWLGDMSDLIFVFFDPIGQALCKRTLNLVEKLNERHSDRIRFYLSKADEAGHETDRQRVMMQIVQELCKRPGLNRCGFDMHTIYIPNPNKPVRCVNQIEESCKEIERTINHTIQNTLNMLENDCERISELIDRRIHEDSFNRSTNLWAQSKGLLFGTLGLFLPITIIISVLLASVPNSMLLNVLGESLTVFTLSTLGPVISVWELVPPNYQVTVIVVVLTLSFLCLIISKVAGRTKPTLNRKQMKTLLAQQEYVQSHVKGRKQQLYQEYLQQSVAEHDL